jgi:hypothetical protein
MNVTFKREFEWAILPKKQSVQVTEHDNRELYEQNFRWVRQYRKKEFCLPWRVGHELGWYLYCPIDVTVYPIEDCELSLDERELESAHKLLNLRSIWKRENSYISVTNDWMKLYQFKGKNSNWEAMFIPNGDGTAEWRQGFSVATPDNYSLLISPLEKDLGLGVHYGLLLDKHNSAMRDNGGMSIAIKPNKIVRLNRGQPIARLIPIANESINMGCEYNSNV